MILHNQIPDIKDIFANVYPVEYSTGAVGEESGSMLPQVTVKQAHFRTNIQEVGLNFGQEPKGD